MHPVCAEQLMVDGMWCGLQARTSATRMFASGVRSDRRKVSGVLQKLSQPTVQRLTGTPFSTETIQDDCIYGSKLGQMSPYGEPWCRHQKMMAVPGAGRQSW